MGTVVVDNDILRPFIEVVMASPKFIAHIYGFGRFFFSANLSPFMRVLLTVNSREKYWLR